MRRITEEQPVRPRAVNPAIPRDLETIVLKAIAREPAHRYASAEELADDLGRFLEDRPIRARRARRGRAALAMVAAQSDGGQPDRTCRRAARSGRRGGNRGLCANHARERPGDARPWPASRSSARRPKPCRRSPWRPWTTFSSSTFPTGWPGMPSWPSTMPTARRSAFRSNRSCRKGPRPCWNGCWCSTIAWPGRTWPTPGFAGRLPTPTVAWAISIAGWATSSRPRRPTSRRLKATSNSSRRQPTTPRPRRKSPRIYNELGDLCWAARWRGRRPIVPCGRDGRSCRRSRQHGLRCRRIATSWPGPITSSAGEARRKLLRAADRGTARNETAAIRPRLTAAMRWPVSQVLVVPRATMKRTCGRRSRSWNT